MNGNGTEENPYKISCVSDFKEVKEAPNSNIEIVNDIYIDSLDNLPTDKFSLIFENLGVLDGNSNKLVFQTDEISLPVFGTNQGIIKNINIEGLEFHRRGSDGINLGLVGTNFGVIRNCKVQRTKFISRENRDEVSLYSRLFGGICGSNLGEIDRCSVSYDYIINNGSFCAGGITGLNPRNIIDSSVSCYSISNSSYFGGICSENRGVVIYSDYAEGAEYNCKGKKKASLVVANEGLVKQSFWCGSDSVGVRVNNDKVKMCNELGSKEEMEEAITACKI